MMWPGQTARDQTVALRPADETIQQSIPMNVAGFLAVTEKTEPAQTMDASPHPGPL